MKFTALFAVCFLLACFAIQQAKSGFDTIKTAKNQQIQVIAAIDK